MPGSESDLPVTVGRWLAAFSPILILLLLLVWRRWSTSAAGPVALAAAVAAALLLFQTPLRTLAVAAGKGVWDAIFVLYVIWPALILYNVANAAGAFVAIQKGARSLMPDRLLVVLAFAWVLASFIQAIAGFGTPLAVTVPLLIGLGVKPVYAVALPIIGAAWGNMFGSLGATWLATQTVVNLEDPTQTLRYATLLLWIPNLMAGLGIAWMYGHWWALKRAAPAIAVVSLLHGGLQFLLVPILPTIGNFLAASAALGAIFGLNLWGFYRQKDEDEPDLVFERWAWIPPEDEADTGKPERTGETRAEEAAQGRKQAGGQQTLGPEDAPGRSMSLPLAFAPYGVLAVLVLVGLLVPPVRSFLEQVQVGLPFPETTTGYAVERSAVDAYAAFTPLTHPGTFLLLSAAVGYILYRAKGFYPEGRTLLEIVREAARDALPATTAITALLLISKVMDHAGEITVLALGIAAISPTLVFVALSNFIGILGALITSSNTASNVLFAPLQATVAQAEGISVSLAVAAQSAGGATGNAIAPGDALLGATVAGVPDQLGVILRRVLPWTLITGVLISAATLAIYFLT